jgi:hypothetical protein
MFRPLAQSVILLLCSSLLLTITLVPALCASGLGSGGTMKEPQFLNVLRSAYEKFSKPAAVFGGGFWRAPCCWRAEPVFFQPGWARISCLTWTKAGWL